MRHKNTEPKGLRIARYLTILVFFVAIVGFGLFASSHINIHTKTSAISSKITQIASSTKTQAVKVTPPPSACSSNSLSQLILVSISQRHMWACNGSTVAYNSPVITGMEFLPADLTPTGTYHIYAKLTNYWLDGCDSTGCWHDHVNYYMKFLLNQYGTYGFHDASWRSPSDFGNIDPNSSNASHGCVELPTATAAWLYSWSQIGTTVTITT